MWRERLPRRDLFYYGIAREKIHNCFYGSLFVNAPYCSVRAEKIIDVSRNKLSVFEGSSSPTAQSRRGGRSSIGALQGMGLVKARSKVQYCVRVRTLL